MKKYLFLYVLLCACLAETSFAQLQAGKPLTKKEPLLQIPMVHITPVESLFVPVHINLLKPFVVSLNPIVFARHENPACEYFKKFKATLVLKAERANNVNANLQWETKYAFYAKGFDIERSLADTLHFEPVNFTASSAATSFKKNYHLPDYNDYNGISFYRIKQHNGDSGFAYSNIVSIKGYESTPFKIYPVPASGEVWVDVLPYQSGNIEIIIYDPAGKMVLRQFASCRGNVHLVQSINISKLAAGIYQLNILLPDKSFVTGKFIKK